MKLKGKQEPMAVPFFLYGAIVVWVCLPTNVFVRSVKEKVDRKASMPCAAVLGAALFFIVFLQVVSGVTTVRTQAGYDNTHYRDGVGTEAAFQKPNSVAVFSDGAMVVADTENHCIRLVTAQGIATTLAGSDTSDFADGAGTAARFYNPRGVAVLSSGNIVVADTDNHRIRIVTRGGVVTTLAGSGSGAADGVGTSAKFSYPVGVAPMPSGNIVVGEHHRIRIVTPNGGVSTLAGISDCGFADGTGTSAKFCGPSGVAVLPSGNFVVADASNHRIRIVTLNGVVTTLAGSGTGFADGAGTSAKFTFPVGVAVLSSGNIVVADSDNSRIRIVTPNGTVNTLAGNGNCDFADGTGTSAKLCCPKGVAVLPSGSIVVADSSNNRIRLAALSGAVRTLAGCESTCFADGEGIDARFSSPGGVAALPNGNVVVADTANQRIRLVTPSGAVSTVTGKGTYGWADGSRLTAQFYNPRGVAVLLGGSKIVVADTANHRIRIVTLSDGVVSTLAGGSNSGFADGPGTSAKFNEPYGVAVLTSGNIVVADFYNSRIRIVTLNGVVSTLAGGSSSSFADGTGTSAKFNGPYGVAVLLNGNIVVADSYNNCIRIVTLNGVVTTLAGGSSSSGGSADGTGTSARFSNPRGVAVLPNGTVVVADTNNHRIRIVTLSGVVSTLAGGFGFVDGTVTTARFKYPNGAAALPNGNIVVTDTDNQRLRMIEFLSSATQQPTQLTSQPAQLTSQPSPTATTTQQPSCGGSTFYNETQFSLCSPAVSCIAEMCSCLSVTSRVVSCLKGSSATCAQRTRCIGKSMRCLNFNAEKFLNNRTCDTWATPIHLDVLYVLSPNINYPYRSSQMAAQCQNAVCLYMLSSYNPRQCSTSPDQICAWGDQFSFATELVIGGPFLGAFNADAIQEVLEKDLASRFGSPVAVEVTNQSSIIVVASVLVPRGYDLTQLYLMTNSSAWLYNFKALVGQSVTSVRFTNMPTTTAAPPTARPTEATTTRAPTTRPTTTRATTATPTAQRSVTLIVVIVVVVFGSLVLLVAIGFGLWRCFVWRRASAAAAARKEIREIPSTDYDIPPPKKTKRETSSVHTEPDVVIPPPLGGAPAFPAGKLPHCSPDDPPLPKKKLKRHLTPPPVGDAATFPAVEPKCMELGGGWCSLILLRKMNLLSSSNPARPHSLVLSPNV